jgi:hypothetical protein
MKDTITVQIEIRRRNAICDFCSQSNQDCFNPLNAGTNDGERDICFACVDRLHALLHATPGDQSA